jgi:hypothetical protein
MCDSSLHPDAVKRFLNFDRPEGEFGALDSVGVGIYERLLRRLPGIRIGRVTGGAIVWEG